MGITDRKLYECACSTALELPATEIYSFTEGWEAARVQGKWFFITSLRDGKRIIVLKQPPEEVVRLQQAYDEIGPGYHMNKKHWVTVQAGPGIDEKLVRELIIDAFLTVVLTLPKSQRPFGWDLR